jgi:polar amino acid transport system substrate-binding protein
MTMTSRTKFRSPLPALLASMLLGAALETAQAQQPPAPGTSPRIDAIKKAGALRIAVLSNPPWLVENTTSSGDAWSGPAWLLANEYARLLGVKVQLVPVSHETKVPVLASNQADMTISPLSVTPERLKVVDFVTYSATALCVFGRADNPKVASAKSVDEFNRPDVTIAYFTGGGGTAAPVEEILAKRADVSPINRVPWMALSRKVKGLQALPQGNNCQDSTEMATPIGLAIDKSQPEYLNWLKAVAESMNAKLKADEARLINTM